LQGLAEAFAELPTRSVVLGGELCLCDIRGRPDFRALHAEMRQHRPDDLRSLSLSQRQKDLARLCGKGRETVPHLFLVEAFPEGEPLLEWCARYRLEGIMSKRRASGYGSGPNRPASPDPTARGIFAVVACFGLHGVNLKHLFDEYATL
jgi:ATP-dependent DNA ligase